MRFVPIDVISAGCRSEVHRCVDRLSTLKSEQLVAIKMIGSKEQAYEEISKMLLVGHRHIISIRDIVEDENFVGIVMPCAQMDLRSFMGRVRYSTDVMLQIKLQTMAAVHHIHTRGILHLDIKPENICIDLLQQPSSFSSASSAELAVHCVLLDFGSSIVAEELLQRLCSDGDNAEAATTIQTTKGYRSPELKQRGILSSACDIYSAGVVFAELVDNRSSSSLLLQEQRHKRTHLVKEDAGEALSVVPFHQLSLDMRHEDFKSRPSSREVLVRLGDAQIHKPLLTLLQNAACPMWSSPIASSLIARCGGGSSNSVGFVHQSVARTFINDHQSNDLQKLVTLVRSADLGHIRDAFWLLFETSVEEVDIGGGCASGLSVLSILHYFESRIYLAKEHGFFYVKSLDILSRLPYFVLTDDMKLHLWKLSSISHACERPILRCLASCWTTAASDDTLAAWCSDERKRWGVRQEAFSDFAARFADDWDVSCAEAVRRVAGFDG